MYIEKKKEKKRNDTGMHPDTFYPETYKPQNEPTADDGTILEHDAHVCCGGLSPVVSPLTYA